MTQDTTRTVDAVMRDLEAAGDPGTHRTYLRHGAREPLFGVKFGQLRPMAKRIGTDHELALGLWATGNVDARLLACMVADPAQATEALLDAWLTDIDTYFLVDTFVGSLASRVPGARERAERWIASDRDRTAQAGWDLLGTLATNDPSVPDAWFRDKLDVIVERIHDYGNWTRRAANGAIINIGLRDAPLEAAAVAASQRMGYVEFDPGMTACVMPDPVAYIARTKAYRAQRAAKGR